MEAGILTKEQDSDGVVVSTPRQDNFNVSSDNPQILRLEICKAQVTKDMSNDCLAVIQQDINKQSSSMGGISIFGFGLAFILIVFIIFFRVTGKR